MFSSRALAIIVVVAMTGSAVNCFYVESEYYEEKFSYYFNQQCKPSKLDTGLKCKNIGPAVPILGGLVSISRFVIIFTFGSIRFRKNLT